MGFKIDRDLSKEIYKIGVPSFLETLFTTFTNIIDSKMVSALGVTAISAISVTNAPRLFILSVFFSINIVLTSLVARCVGEKNRDEANRIFDLIMKFVIIASIILSILAVVLARPLMIVFSHQEDTLDASVVYFRIVMGGMIFNTVFMAINAAMRGFGKTNLTFISNVVSSVVNIILNYLLIEGHFGFPALGVKGAAIATVAGMVAACIQMTLVAMKKDYFVNIPYCLGKKFRPTKEGSKEVLEMYRSTFTDSLATRVSILIISGIVARIGSFQMAVYSIGMHLLNVNVAVGTGLQTAAVALIGRSHGARDKALLKQYKRNIISLSAVSALVLATLFILGGRTFFGFFSNEAEFISIGAKSCLFIGAITISQTLKFAYVGCLQGVGAMKEVMRASIVSFAFVNLSVLAVCVFVLKMGIWGVWTGSLVSQTVQAIMVWNYTQKLDAFKEDA